MRRLFLLIVLVGFLSCSSDDDNNNCNERVFGTSRTCNPAPNCVFKIKHGPSSGGTWTENEEVDEETYNHYNDLYENSIEKETDVCWKG